MAIKYFDRVKDTTTITGTANVVVSGTAPTGFRTFSSVLSVSDTFYYTIAGGTEWEVGIGTYLSSNTFQRTSVTSSSNAGASVSFSAGTKEVFIDAPSDAWNSINFFTTPTTYEIQLADIAPLGTLPPSLPVTSNYMIYTCAEATRTAYDALGLGEGWAHVDISSVPTGMLKLEASTEWFEIGVSSAKQQRGDAGLLPWVSSWGWRIPNFAKGYSVFKIYDTIIYHIEGGNNYFGNFQTENVTEEKGGRRGWLLTALEYARLGYNDTWFVGAETPDLHDFGYVDDGNSNSVPLIPKAGDFYLQSNADVYMVNGYNYDVETGLIIISASWTFMLNVGGGGSAGHTIKNDAVSLGAQPNLNFTGTGVIATENVATTSIDVTIDAVPNSRITISEFVPVNGVDGVDGDIWLQYTP